MLLAILIVAIVLVLLGVFTALKVLLWIGLIALVIAGILALAGHSRL